MAKLVSATYGEALFELAVEQNKVDTYFDEARIALETFSSNEDLMKVLNHPKIVKEDKMKLMEDCYSSFLSKEFTGFLVLIVQKDRYREIPEIINHFIGLVKEYKKIGIAYVTAPMELSDNLKEKITDRLLATTSYKSFEMHYSVDQSLIGGLVIRIGDKVVDSSIRTKLSEMSRDLYKLNIV